MPIVYAQVPTTEHPFQGLFDSDCLRGVHGSSTRQTLIEVCVRDASPARQASAKRR
jgi:hypothetical protein